MTRCSFVTAAAAAVAVVSSTSTATTAFIQPSAPSSSVRSSLTTLASKNSDRARTERMLEESMGDDWRLFRARLVAQEQAEAAAESKPSSKNSDRPHFASPQKSEAKKKSSSSSSDKKIGKKKDIEPDTTDDELHKNGQLSDLFGAAISSIFSKNNKNGSSDKKKNKKSSGNIFDGKTVGGADAVDGISVSSSWKSYDPKDLELKSSYHDDPFCSAEEIPIHLQPKEQNMVVSKHRWAHEISHIEPGSVLVANEKLGGVFHQTIVLLVDHHDTTGTTGIVINRYVGVWLFSTIRFGTRILLSLIVILSFQ